MFLMSQFGFGFILASCLSAFIKGTRGSEAEDKLLDVLLDETKYNQLSRPVRNHNDSLQVSIGIAIRQLVQLDEVNERLSASVWKKIIWHDYRLSWNSSDYYGLTQIHVPPSKIWIPDIILYNSVDEEVKNTGDAGDVFRVSISSDGKCEHYPLGISTTECQIDIQWFPFDDQFCTLDYLSWTSTIELINLTMATSPVHGEADLQYMSPDGSWLIMGAPGKVETQTYGNSVPWPHVKFTIHLRRRVLFYIFNLILPCAIIAALTCIAFLLSPGERIGLGITTLLALSVYQIVILDKIPTSSEGVPLISIYFMTQFLITALAIGMMIVTDRVHSKIETKPPALMNHRVHVIIFVILARLIRIKPPKTTARVEEDKKSSGTKKSSSPKNNGILMSLEKSDVGVLGSNDVAAHLIRLLDAMTKRLENLNETNAEETREDESDTEIRPLSGKHRKTSVEDWEFAAKVVDLACFWIFAVTQSLLSLAMILVGFISRAF